MKTYQDYLAIPQDTDKIIDFIRAAINDHKASRLYKEAVDAYEYQAHRNKTITEFKKLLYTVTGEVVPDNFSANWKMASNFFAEFNDQEVQYLLGNGVTWEDEETEKKLGEDFDTRLQDLAEDALVGAVSFGFYNLDHIQNFKVTEFVPLIDEVTSGLMAGIRFWQIDNLKPLRATFYELDGYTDYIWEEGKGRVLHEKRGYKENIVTTPIDGTEHLNYENYPSFPIIPLWANKYHQSELTGLREQIDCYDLIKSGFANDVDDASMIYWTIQNAGGMDDVDLAKFIDRIKTVHAAVVEDTGAKAESHTMDVPFGSREALLNRLRSDLYEDAMALDTKSIADGAVTATQIKAAYERLNSKCDKFEFRLNDFLDGLMKVAGIEDHPTFTRSKIVNVQEEIQTLLQAAQYLSQDYVTRKILTLYGDGDLADEMLEEMDQTDLERMTDGDEYSEDDIDSMISLDDVDISLEEEE